MLEPMAACLIFLGIWTGLSVNWFSGLWLAFIGWFLMNAAQESVVQVSIRSALSGLRVEDVISRDCPTVFGRISRAELVRDHVLKTGQRCFTVTDGNRLEGLVTLYQIKAEPQERWAQMSVEEAMTPVSQVRGVAPISRSPRCYGFWKAKMSIRFRLRQAIGSWA
jgi:hypothetical protein